METPVAHSSRWSRTALLAFAIAAPAFAIALIRTNIYVALAPLFLSHVLFLWATLVPGCQWWGPVVTSFKTDRKEVWITIDDGPSPAHTEQILDILERFNARATFFVIGERAEYHPRLITEILVRGHQVANHTHTHPSGTFWCSAARRTAREIDRCSEVRGERMSKLFRAPVGLKNPFLHRLLSDRGLLLVNWTARGFDTLSRDPSAVARRIAKRARPGAIILLHEGHRVVSKPEFHLRCIELTLQRLANDGYEFTVPTPSQLQ